MTKKEELIQLLGFDDKKFLWIGIPTVAFFIPILFFNASLNEGIISYLPKFTISLIHTATYWLAIRYIFIYTRRNFPGYRQTQKRIIYFICLALISFFVLDQILEVCQFIPPFEKSPELPNVTELDYDVASLTIIALCSAIYESIFLYSNWKISIIEREKLKRENVQSQLEGLKSQVNPHFLFNSLNTLTYIIPEDPEKAVKFVQKLSKVYRYILEIREKELISLEEELIFLNAYNFLLKERFGENLNIQIDVPKVYEHARIVPLSLQILFENVIKHNIISKDKPLTIEVFVNDLQQLTIRNKLQRKKQKMHSTKVGLQNIKNRYAFFTDDKVQIEVSENHFSVSLPLLHLSLSPKETTSISNS